MTVLWYLLHYDTRDKVHIKINSSLMMTRTKLYFKDNKNKYLISSVHGNFLRGNLLKAKLSFLFSSVRTESPLLGESFFLKNNTITDTHT